jgi:o-succinylbenzoate---CoA ligase
VPDLVLIDQPAGPRFLVAVRSVLDAGNAFAPIDARLPAAERAAVLEVLRPTAVIADDGVQRPLTGGRPVEPGDAFVLTTSGSTGMPKAVVHTIDSMRASAVATSNALGIDPDADRWLACLPLAHIGGLSVLLRSICTGTPVTVLPGFDADRVTREAKTGGATRVSLVTKALRMVDPALFRTVLLGGASPPADRPSNCIATYGMTETGSGVVYERRALDGVELRVDGDGGIWVRGPMLLRSYRTHADDIDPKTSDGWFATGDAGGFHDDGSLFVTGRIGDVIVSGGEKIWPERADAALLAHPAVADVAVVGRPDPDWGMILVAHVVPSNTQQPPQLDDLRDFVKRTLPAWYAPKALRFHEALPRTALGKIRRAELRDSLED